MSVIAMQERTWAVSYVVYPNSFNMKGVSKEKFISAQIAKDKPMIRFIYLGSFNRSASRKFRRFFKVEFFSSSFSSLVCFVSVSSGGGFSSVFSSILISATDVCLE